MRTTSLCLLASILAIAGCDPQGAGDSSDRAAMPPGGTGGKVIDADEGPGESESDSTTPSGTDGGDDGGDDGGGDSSGDPGCTRTQGFWKNHARAWPSGTEQELLCGTNWATWLWTPTAAGEYGEHWTLLAHQYIAARLNVAAGATTADAVTDALAAAQTLLEACAPVPDPDEASSLATVLDRFNNGLEGVEHCDERGDTGGDEGGGDEGGGDEGGDTDGAGESGGDDSDSGETAEGGSDPGEPIP